MWECGGCHRDDGMTQRSGHVGVWWLSPGWRDDTKEWTCGSVVAVTGMTG